MNEIARIAVVVKHDSAAAVVAAHKVLEIARERGLDVLADPDSAGLLGLNPGPQRGNLAAQSELVVVLGGDGTLLSVACGEVGTTPILGINLGTLGFLAEHGPEELSEVVIDVLEGEARIESRQRLEVTIETKQTRLSSAVLNDAVLNRRALARMVTVDIRCDSDLVSRFRGDGLIVATPTGATAYNLSAGGPILVPGLEAMLITPICPHALTARPIAVPMDVELEVRVAEDSGEVMLSLDGQKGYPIGDRDDVVRIRRHPEPVRLVVHSQQSFFQILHQKLKWGDRDS